MQKENKLKELKNELLENKQKNIILQITLNAIAGILILFTDFAGWYHSNYYAGYYQEGYIYLGSGILSTVLLTGMFMLIGFNIKVAYGKLKNKFTKKEEEAKEKIIIRNCIIALAIIFIATLAFNIINAATDTEEWWMGPAFYGMVVSFISTIMLNMKLKSNPKKHKLK